MKRTARLGLVALAVLLGVFGGIRLVRRWLWDARPANALPIRERERSPVDLRPAAIAKLQGLVQAGSDSLYRLRVDSLGTALASGTLVFTGVGVYPDSAVLRRRAVQHRLPDDVFRVEAASVRLSGITLHDLVHRRDLVFRALVLDRPQITVWHRPQSYNRQSPGPRRSLFSRIHSQIDRLVIDTVQFRNGTVADYTGGKRTSFQGIALTLGGIRVDSASESDPSRVLFAETVALRAGPVRFPLGRSGYELRLSGVAIDEKRDVRIRGLALHPRGGRAAFTRRQRERTTVFTLDVPGLTVHGADWWAALHGDALRAREMRLAAPRLDVYLDKRLPTTAGIDRANFPQQLLMDLPVPVSLGRVTVDGGRVDYEEFNDATDALGRVSFSRIALTATGVTNISREVAAQRTARVRATGWLLDATPLAAHLDLELARRRKGAFQADVQVGQVGYQTLDPLAESLGQVRLTSGRLDGGQVALRGNNDAITGNFSVRYHDLHLELLQSRRNAEGRLKQKLLLSKLGNVLFVKDNNPSRGVLRQPTVSLKRTDQPSFFNFLWNALVVGLLKTFGVPERFAPS